jgi:hypothetical protein
MQASEQLINELVETSTHLANAITFLRQQEQPEAAPEGYEFTGTHGPGGDDDITLINLGDGTTSMVWGQTHTVGWQLREKPNAPTVESVYGCKLSELKAPKGYRLGEFAPIAAGDTCLEAGNGKNPPVIPTSVTWVCGHPEHYRIHLIPEPVEMPKEPGQRLYEARYGDDACWDDESNSSRDDWAKNERSAVSIFQPTVQPEPIDPTREPGQRAKEIFNGVYEMHHGVGSVLAWQFMGEATKDAWAAVEAALTGK